MKDEPRALLASSLNRDSDGPNIGQLFRRRNPNETAQSPARALCSRSPHSRALTPCSAHDLAGASRRARRRQLLFTDNFAEPGGNTHAAHRSTRQPGRAPNPAEPAARRVPLQGRLFMRNPLRVTGTIHHVHDMLTAHMPSRLYSPPHSKALAGAASDWRSQNEPYVVGRMMAPRDAHALAPGTQKHVSSYDKGE